MTSTPFSNEVAERVKRGDSDAIAQVYVAMSDRLLGYLVARIKDRATAEDLLEQTFIKLIRKGHTIQGDATSMKVWLFRVAYFTAIDHIRKVDRRRESALDEDFSTHQPSEEMGPADELLLQERRQIVQTAMQYLSEDQRSVIEMRYIAGLSAAEVAKALNKSEGAIRSLQHRAERAMHRMLADVMQDENSLDS